MFPTPYSELNDVLREFHSRLVAVLGDDVVGIYVHGSLAIGDFDEAHPILPLEL
jgi:predicted nucleotidyltransferase